MKVAAMTAIVLAMLCSAPPARAGVELFDMTWTSEQIGNPRYDGASGTMHGTSVVSFEASATPLGQAWLRFNGPGIGPIDGQWGGLLNAPAAPDDSWRNVLDVPTIAGGHGGAATLTFNTTGFTLDVFSPGSGPDPLVRFSGIGTRRVVAASEPAAGLLLTAGALLAALATRRPRVSARRGDAAAGP